MEYWKTLNKEPTQEIASKTLEFDRYAKQFRLNWWTNAEYYAYKRVFCNFRDIFIIKQELWYWGTIFLYLYNLFSC